MELASPGYSGFPGTKPDLHHGDTLVGSEKMERRRERVSRIGERSCTRGKIPYRDRTLGFAAVKREHEWLTTRWSPLDYI